MTRARLIRLGGLAFILAGVFIVLARVFEVVLYGDQPLSEQATSELFVPWVGIPGLAGSILFLIGIVVLYARQCERAGLFGLVSFLFAFVGTALTAGANWTYAFGAPYLAEVSPEILDTGFGDPRWGVFGVGFASAYMLGGLGWVVMCISVLRAGELRRWVGLTMLISVVAAGVVPLGIAGVSGIVVNVLLGLGPVVCGYELWARPEGGELGEG